MSRIFVPAADGWSAVALDSDRHLLDTLMSVGSAEPRSGRERTGASADALILRVREQADRAEEGWALVADAGARVFVNGERLALGIALLRDRDELRVGDAAPAYFSAERLACVEPCARDDAPRCPRCAQPIERGEPSVRCPGCGVVHHQRPDRRCWTHVPSCALCPQSSDLDAGWRWTPEEL